MGLRHSSGCKICLNRIAEQMLEPATSVFPRGWKGPCRSLEYEGRSLAFLKTIQDGRCIKAAAAMVLELRREACASK